MVNFRNTLKFSILALIIVLVVGVLTTALTFAQETDENGYIGVSECIKCHTSVVRPYSDSNHALALQSVADDASMILADFGQGEDVRLVQFPGEDTTRAFTVDDVSFTMGTGRYLQRYVYLTDDDNYFVFPAEWNTIDQVWQPFAIDENWPAPAYDWLQNCAGCHTTGLDLEQMTWMDDGVQCESCHGMGSTHAELADAAGSRASDEEYLEIREAIVLSPDAQICGQCHSDGATPDGSHPFPVGYSAGMDLDETFVLPSTDDPEYWWSSLHGKGFTMQYNEWTVSTHSNALTTMQDSDYAEESCLTCHSSDYRYAQQRQAAYEAGELLDPPPTIVTLETAQFGVTCATCHNPHSESDLDNLLVSEPYALCLECHQDTEAISGIHHPAREMYEGLLVEGLPEVIRSEDGTLPSTHSSTEDRVLCTTCHMPEINIGGIERATHSLIPTLPSGDVDEPNSVCADCHDDLSPGYLLRFVNDAQESVSDRLIAAQSAVNAAPDVEEWVTSAIAFVDGDGSLGVHNYNYTEHLLDAVEIEMGLVQLIPQTATQFISASDPETCEECHKDEYRLWSVSPHANASSSSHFLQDYADQGRPDYCLSCHASGYDSNTRTYDFEGVVCSSCHIAVTEGEHPPAPVHVADTPDICGRCHSGAHAPTYDEWLASEHKVANVDCGDCHTPHNNGLLLGDVNSTCGDCHQDALVDEIHMGSDMTCVDCHMNRRVSDDHNHVLSTGHTMNIDPGVCSECHGNTHLLSVQESNRSPAEVVEVEALRNEITELEELAEQNRSTSVVGGALGMLVMVGILFFMNRMRSVI
jgi:predicted CXXCH cytochrome family protein